MKGESEGEPGLWLQPQDKLGRPSDAAILATAQRNWKRILAYAEQHGHDASVAAGVLEAVVGALSSMKQRHPSLYHRIENLDVYLFWAAIWRLNKLVAKEPALEYVGSLDDLSSLDRVHDLTGALRIEKYILVKELMGFMSARTRFLFSRREMGYTWPEIAASLGTTALRLRVQFSEGLAGARRRILGKADSKSDPTPESGRPE